MPPEIDTLRAENIRLQGQINILNNTIRGYEEEHQAHIALKEMLADLNKQYDADLTQLIDWTGPTVHFHNKSFTMDRIHKLISRVNADKDLADLFNWAVGLARKSPPMVRR